MLYAVLDEKAEMVMLPKGVAIFLTKEEAIDVMKGHSKWTIREIGRIWP